MGAWGPGIFSDDTAADVRDEFKDLIAGGLDGRAATERLVASYRDVIRDPDDGPVFWIALAATQYGLGCLQPDVCRRALEVLDSGADLRRWDAEASQADARKRRANLEKLRTQLVGAQKKPQRVRVPFREETDWRVGDHWAYRLPSDRWIVFRVVDLRVETPSADPGAPLELTWPGTLPVVEVLDQQWTAPPPLADARRAPARVGSMHLDVETTVPIDRLVIARATARDYPQARLLGLGCAVPAKPRRRLLRRQREASSTLALWKWLDRKLDEEWDIR